MTKLVFRNANEALPHLAHQVMNNGYKQASRNGESRELLMNQIVLTNPFPAEITTPGRKVSLPAQIAETVWLLAGRNDIEWLSHYLPRAKDFSDDGETWRGGYGPRIRGWNSNEEWGGKDQLAHVVDLLKQDPDTRRAVISIYDPMIDMQLGKDVPCNDFLHFVQRNGELHLHVFTRSNDLMWGWSGINSFEWAKLLEVVATLTGFRVGELTFSISSLHLYERHYAKAEQLAKGKGYTPTFQKANPMFDPELKTVVELDTLLREFFVIETRIRNNEHGLDRAIAAFREPMLRSWLYVLWAWHTDDLRAAVTLAGTSLNTALWLSPKRKQEPRFTVPQPDAKELHLQDVKFVEYVSALHKDKDAAYGASWAKRGEQMSIMANIARKVDRLGVDGGGDTSTDTAIDLLVYLLKYNYWLQRDVHKAPLHGDTHVVDVATYLHSLQGLRNPNSTYDLEMAIRVWFQELERKVVDQDTDRRNIVWTLAELAYPLAYRLWHADQNKVRFFNGYADQEEATA